MLLDEHIINKIKYYNMDAVIPILEVYMSNKIIKYYSFHTDIIIIFNDDFKLNITYRNNQYLTSIEQNGLYYYFGYMPHDNIDYLKNEIIRMSNSNTRNTVCMSNYFKGFY